MAPRPQSTGSIVAVHGLACSVACLAGSGAEFMSPASADRFFTTEPPGKPLSIFLLMVYEGIRRRQWHPTPVLLSGESHGRRSLVGCSPRGREESDTTERLYFHFSLSCNGKGNGNPLQCSCLENLRDGEAWWASVYGVAQSRTRLK